MSEKILRGFAVPATSPPPPAVMPKVVDRRVLLAHEEAGEILRQAEEGARALLAAAGGEAEQIRRAAREEGAREGLEEWLGRFAALAEARERIFAEARPEILRLAVRIAEKILRRSLAADPLALLPLIEEALAASSGARGAGVLRLHAADAAALGEGLARRVAADPRFRGLEVVADADLPPGSCRIETAGARIDAGVETQLSAVLALLCEGEAP
ncbi:MAG TPA: FliH/SctL family protein [Thermoanaerobaculia bacterium]|nr:FliH/SctL family protein [Thermoanaerobaculia bacterium]